MKRIVGIFMITIVLISSLNFREGSVGVLTGPSFFCPPNSPRALFIDSITKVEVTGYYTPLPGQRRYACGSYEDDVRMNGDYVTSTRERVRLGGMASSNLNIAPYGRKWIIKGVGIFVVNDCMGSFTENLRLDIFCGEGDDGLDAAINIGCGRCQARRVRQN